MQAGIWIHFISHSNDVTYCLSNYVDLASTSDKDFANLSSVYYFSGCFFWYTVSGLSLKFLVLEIRVSLNKRRESFHQFGYSGNKLLKPFVYARNKHAHNTRICSSASPVYQYLSNNFLHFPKITSFWHLLTKWFRNYISLKCINRHVIIIVSHRNDVKM